MVFWTGWAEISLLTSHLCPVGWKTAPESMHFVLCFSGNFDSGNGYQIIAKF